MLPNRQNDPLKSIGWIQIMMTLCVLITTSIPYFFSVKLASQTKVDTANEITKTLYYALYFLVILLAASTMTAIIYLSSLG